MSTNEIILFRNVWKAEGVAVGYAYEKGTNGDEWQQRFKGSWVTHSRTTSDGVSTISTDC